MNRYARYYVDMPNAPSRGIGILAHFVYIKNLTELSYWMLLVVYVLLVIGTSSRGA